MDGRTARCLEGSRRRWIRRVVPAALLIALMASTAPSLAEEPREEPSEPPSSSLFKDLGSVTTRWHDEPYDSGYWESNLFKRWFNDQEFLVTQWWGEELHRPAFAIPLTVSTALAMSYAGSASGIDGRLSRSMQRRLGGKDNQVAKALSRLGDREMAALTLGGAYLLSRWGRNERLSRASSLAAEALLSAGLWNIALKQLSRRERPDEDGTGEFFIDDPAAGQSTGSFPSGHTMGAFAVATVLADEYSDKRWVPWVSYSMAGLIAGSRVSLGRHYPSDVVVGALLGHSIGKMVTVRQWGSRDEKRTQYQPVVDPAGGHYGFFFTRSW